MSNNFDPTEHNKTFDKKTILAFVLIGVVVTVFMTLQYVFFPAKPLPIESPAAVSQTSATPVSAPALSAVSPEEVSTLQAFAANAPERVAEYTLATDLFTARFTNRGGELVSLKLRKHIDKNDKDGVVEMFITNSEHPGTMSLAFGGTSAPAITELMNVSRPEPNTIEFSRVFPGRGANGEIVPFTLKKRYEFKDGDYMFKLSVIIENSVTAAPVMGDGSFAYTLFMGPQIGPDYSNLPKNSDTRKMLTFENGKRKEAKTKNGTITSDTRISWAAIAGKYFALVAIPDETLYSATYTNTIVDGKPGKASMSFSRPALKASGEIDVFYIYAGPKSNKELAKYENPGKNSFNRSGDSLESIIEGTPILGWLETLLKWGMNFFNNMVHNYGIAIILLTILVRAVMFPLTFKGSKAQARMQELQPKMKELQDKYKGNPQKLNQEMAEFYKREGYNPLSGCLPVLLQFPIFIAMYALFNNHFDLRGASFITGWINDLSLPESVFDFNTVNLVIWQVSAIRILPIVYLASQLLYGKFMQQPSAGGQSQTQMKIMMYGMPIVFFFVLYDMPSGLLVYWIASNVLTTVQQVIINRVIHKHRAEVIAESASHQKIIAGKNPKSIKKGRK